MKKTKPPLSLDVVPLSTASLLPSLDVVTLPAVTNERVTIESLNSLGCNPLQFAADVVNGKALTKSHPFLFFLRSWCIDTVDMIESGEASLAEQLKALMDRADVVLLDSWTSPELRSKHAIHLLDLIERSRVGDNAVGSGLVEPLTDAEVVVFKRTFDKSY